MRHVLVIGQPSAAPHNADTQAVFDKVTSPRVIIRRCTLAGQLLPTLTAITPPRPIDVLDIYDHASPGTQQLGDDVLFQSNTARQSLLVGSDIAIALRGHLSEFASVRLLGCNSALGPKGRLLLFKLAQILGQHRVVFGTNGGTNQQDFDQDGFMLSRGVTYLFDSLAAIDGEAVDHNTRIIRIGALSHPAAPLGFVEPTSSGNGVSRSTRNVRPP